jgi:hypothetical protein
MVRPASLEAAGVEFIDENGGGAGVRGRHAMFSWGGVLQQKIVGLGVSLPE